MVEYRAEAAFGRYFRAKLFKDLYVAQPGPVNSGGVYDSRKAFLVSARVSDSSHWARVSNEDFDSSTKMLN